MHNYSSERNIVIDRPRDTEIGRKLSPAGVAANSFAHAVSYLSGAPITRVKQEASTEESRVIETFELGSISQEAFKKAVQEVAISSNLPVTFETGVLNHQPKLGCKSAVITIN